MNLFGCYSILKHSCFGSCQGRGFCPYCEGFLEGDPKPVRTKITRWDMVKFFVTDWVKDKIFSIRYRKVIKEVVAQYLQEKKEKQINADRACLGNNREENLLRKEDNVHI